ncbi:hypothetical protein [Polluticaenibacter yanchengensis]|uniref:Lipoprotein n=1 Tax=Polluticaenibacter yanchengensis TaxID=3014562 RepID=A0ABT4ULW4_9BACT|nr:hypothetical protein [Chitinophagaceae bacterium LY-5]
MKLLPIIFVIILTACSTVKKEIHIYPKGKNIHPPLPLISLKDVTPIVCDSNYPRNALRLKYTLPNSKKERNTSTNSGNTKYNQQVSGVKVIDYSEINYYLKKGYKINEFERFSCNDTLVINVKDINLKCRKAKIYRYKAFIVNLKSRNRKVKINKHRVLYYENGNTGKPFVGLCKIIYDDRRYSIGYFYDGRPILPFDLPNRFDLPNQLGPSGTFGGFQEYYINNQFAYYGFVETNNGHGNGSSNLARIHYRNNNESGFITYYWETGLLKFVKVFEQLGDSIQGKSFTEYIYPKRKYRQLNNCKRCHHQFHPWDAIDKIINRKEE